MAAGAARAQNAESTIDRRVTAIPASRLTSEPPAALVDPNRQAAAQYFVRYTRPAWFAWIAFQILLLLYLWRSGRAARIRDALKRAIPWTPGVRFVFGAVLAVVAELGALPAQFYDYRILRIMGISTQSPGSWWGDIVLSTALEMAVLGLAVMVILWFVDRSHLWWVYVILLACATSFVISFLYPIAVEPLFNHFTPLPPDRPLTRRIHDLALRAGEGNLPIYVSDLSRRTKAGNAYVVGIGPSKRIVIGDTMLTSGTEDEIIFVVAHELGHDVHRDTFWGSLVGAWIFIFAAAFAVLVSDRVGFRRDDDPLARLALVGALLGCSYVILLPVINTYSRHVEASADTYALQLTGDRAGGVRMLVRFADEDLALVCPGRLARVYWYTHPPIGSRITALTGHPDPCP